MIIGGILLPKVKWESFSKVNSEQDYLAVIEMGERKSVWSYFSFLLRARKVGKQLKNSKGAIGLTGRLGFLNREVVLVAVFENDNVLTGFAHSGQHAKCMEESKKAVKGAFKSAKWIISGSDIPPKLDEAITKISSK